ncbi:hypothetical protein A3Q56_04615, partial [Intoshia linei]
MSTLFCGIFVKFLMNYIIKAIIIIHFIVIKNDARICQVSNGLGRSQVSCPTNKTLPSEKYCCVFDNNAHCCNVYDMMMHNQDEMLSVMSLPLVFVVLIVLIIICIVIKLLSEKNKNKIRTTRQPQRPFYIYLRKPHNRLNRTQSNLVHTQSHPNFFQNNNQ